MHTKFKQKIRQTEIRQLAHLNEFLFWIQNETRVVNWYRIISIRNAPVACNYIKGIV